MITCHYCEDIIEKLNKEYDSLYDENQKQKQEIESMNLKILRMRTQMEFYEKNKWYSDTDVPIAYGSDWHFSRSCRISDIFYEDSVIYNNRIFDILDEDEEEERREEGDHPPEFNPHSPPVYSAKEMMEKVRLLNRRISRMRR